MFTNPRSLVIKMEKLELLIHKKNFNFVGVSEAHMTGCPLSRAISCIGGTGKLEEGEVCVKNDFLVKNEG